jgi:hypothetical protein
VTKKKTLDEVLRDLGYEPMAIPPLFVEARKRISAGAGGEDPIVKEAMGQLREMLGLVGAEPGPIPDPTIGVEPDNCAGCGAFVNGATDLDGDARPKPGDRSVCQHCGAFLKYTNEMRLVLLTADEVTDTIKHLNAEELRVVQALARRRANRGGTA